MRFSNWKVLHKLMLLVGTMTVLVAIVAGFGVTSIHQLVTSGDKVSEASRETLVGARLNEEVVALNRTEYRIASNPSQENLKQVEGVLAEREERVNSYLATLKAHAKGERAATLADVEEKYRKYMESIKNTLRAAKANGPEVVLSEAQKRIDRKVEESRTDADALEEATKVYIDETTKMENSIAETSRSSAVTVEWTMVVISILGLLGGIAMGYGIASTGIAKPLAQSIENITELADGKLDVSIYGSERGDEMGGIARALQVFKDNMIRNKELAEAQAKENEAKQRRAEQLDKLTRDFDAKVSALVSSLSAAATEMEATAGSMTSLAEQGNNRAMTVASAAEETATNVQTVATAAEELTASIQEISSQVANSATRANKAVKDAEETDAVVQELAVNAQKIGEIVELINDIASQTNLLALNATIEAARAGESGKGFAVVASEVKSLANQTAKATEEISAQIAQIQGATGTAVSAIEKVGHSIQEMSEIASAIAAAVEQQGAATQEISRNVQHAAQGTDEVSGSISHVQQAATDTGAASTQVLGAAGELSQMASSLTQEVEQFVSNVRAA